MDGPMHGYHVWNVQQLVTDLTELSLHFLGQRVAKAELMVTLAKVGFFRNVCM